MLTLIDTLTLISAGWFALIGGCLVVYATRPVGKPSWRVGKPGIRRSAGYFAGEDSATSQD